MLSINDLTHVQSMAVAKHSRETSISSVIGSIVRDTCWTVLSQLLIKRGSQTNERNGFAMNALQLLPEKTCSIDTWI